MKMSIPVWYIVALCLSLYPFGQGEWQYFKPDFFILLIAMLGLLSPKAISFVGLSLIGLVYDALLYHPYLGQSVVGLLICAWLCLRFYNKRQFFAKWQECLFVTFLTLQNNLATLLFFASSYEHLHAQHLWVCVFSNTLIWAAYISWRRQ